MLSMPKDLPLVYDRNRRTFMLVLSILIGLLYFSGITSNGIRGFMRVWQTDPKQESYVLIPYNGNSAQLQIDSEKIEEFLKGSPLVEGYSKVDEQTFQNMFNQQSPTNKAWIESIPFPIFLEINLKAASKSNIEKLENQIHEVVKDAQIYTQPRYSSEFIMSFKVIVRILDMVIICLITVFLAVLVLMTRALFAVQEKNIERLSLLGATPAYIKNLYCWFMARCIILSSTYGFLGACIASWAIFMATKQINFFPYGFAVPSIVLYLLLPYSCLLIGVSITYILSSNLLKKLWACA